MPLEFVRPSQDPSGSIPTRRFGHCGETVDGRLFVFGGVGAGEGYLNDLIAIDSDTLVWANLTPLTRGEAPSRRSGASVTLVGQSLVFFGGYSGRKGGHQNDVVVLHTESMAWEHKSTRGRAPRKRSDHAAVLLGHSQIVVFGGYGGRVGNYLNDTHILNTETWEWLPQTVYGRAPQPRAGHSMLLIGNDLVVYGGRNETEVFDDVLLLNTRTWEWRQIETTGPSPGPRSHHSATLMGTDMIVFGGQGPVRTPRTPRSRKDHGELYNDVLALEADHWSWSIPAVAGKYPRRRFGHVAVRMGWKITIFGGFSGGRDALCLNDVIILDASTRGSDKKITTARARAHSRGTIASMASSTSLSSVPTGIRSSHPPNAVRKSSSMSLGTGDGNSSWRVRPTRPTIRSASGDSLNVGMSEKRMAKELEVWAEEQKEKIRAELQEWKDSQRQRIQADLDQERGEFNAWKDRQRTLVENELWKEKQTFHIWKQDQERKLLNAPTPQGTDETREFGEQLKTITSAVEAELDQERREFVTWRDTQRSLLESAMEEFERCKKKQEAALREKRNQLEDMVHGLQSQFNTTLSNFARDLEKQG